MREDEDLLKVAEAITDGTPVDWEAVLGKKRGLAPKLDPLRQIEAIAAAHRTTPPAKEDRPAPILDPLEQTSTYDAERFPALQPAGAAAWGPLRILEKIGEGGFSDVYRAFDPSLEREVALKLRRADKGGAGAESRRFLSEARRLARVRHRNVLIVHGADLHQGRVGLWTELLRGRTLEEELAARGTFSAEEAAHIGIDLCRALAAVHAQGLVHRDVKTTNVMREQGGRIVLMDFGSAAARPGAGAAGEAELLAGTPLYIAPEQILAEKPATPRSDIYALGVVLYRLVSGRVPVEARNWPELVDRHRRRAAVPLSDVRPDLPASIVQVVERAIDPDPKRRYASPGAMERALAAAVGVQEPDEDRRRGLQAWRKRAGAAAALAAGLALAIGAGVAIYRSRLPAPFMGEAALYRQAERVEERLSQGSRVRPGDHLFMEVECPEEAYVYVLNEDELGNVFVLFPVGLDPDNPLRGSVRHRLPGMRAGRLMTWQITSVGGRETFLVIASRRPLEDLERDIARVPRASEDQEIVYAPVSPQSIATLRGAGGLAPAVGATGAAAGSRLSEISRGLSAGAARGSGIWSWQVDLENPAP